MLIATIIYYAQKSQASKSKAFIFCIVYFLTLSAFSVTIEIIRATMKNYFEFLYYEQGGYVNKLFLGWLLFGALILFTSFKYSNKFINDKAI